MDKLFARTAAKPSRGISLIECLVAISIIGILLALILPAVSASRETARRLTCSSNLSQLAKACHAFEESRGRLPSGFRTRASSLQPEEGPESALSVWAMLLRYLGEQAIHDQLKMNEIGFTPFPWLDPPQGITNSHLTSTRITTLVCPSDSVPDGWSSYRTCRGSHFTGIQRHNTAGALNGGMIVFPARFAGITDGTSQTVMASERVVGDGVSGSVRYPRDVVLIPDPVQNTTNNPLAYLVDDFVAFCQSNTSSASGTQSYLGSTWVLNGFLFTWYNHATPPNWRNFDCGHADNYYHGAYGARSMHVGGVNAVMADGAVRFFNDSIDLAVWRALGSRAGNEVLE